MRVEHARRRLSALPALQRAAVGGARAEGAEAEVVPERSGVLVGLGGSAGGPPREGAFDGRGKSGSAGKEEEEEGQLERPATSSSLPFSPQGWGLHLHAK